MKQKDIIDLIDSQLGSNFKKPVAMNTGMKEALANCYNIEGFREYMENSINSMIIINALQSTTELEMAERRGAILFAQKVLSQSKTCYHDFNLAKKAISKL